MVCLLVEGRELREFIRYTVEDLHKKFIRRYNKWEWTILWLNHHGVLDNIDQVVPSMSCTIMRNQRTSTNQYYVKPLVSKYQDNFKKHSTTACIKY